MMQAENTIRKGLITKIHVAKSVMALDQTTYESLLFRVAGKTSCSDMNVPLLEKVMAEFKRLGFKAKTKRAGDRPLAKGEQAAKIRALWLSLYHLGALEDSSEDALAKFVEKHAKVSALQWLTPPKANAAIKALRGWLVRIGGRQPTASDVTLISRFRRENKVRTGHSGAGEIAKIFLILDQIQILKWDSKQALELIADRGLGKYDMLQLIDAPQLDAVIELLGKKVRGGQ